MRSSPSQVRSQYFSDQKSGLLVRLVKSDSGSPLGETLSVYGWNLCFTNADTLVTPSSPTERRETTICLSVKPLSTRLGLHGSASLC